MTALLASLLLTGCLGLDPQGSGSDSGTTGDTGPSWSNFGGMGYPEAVDFGQVVVGSDPSVTEVALTNESDSNIKLTELVLDAGSDFEAEWTSVPWVIGAGGEYVITLSFDPSSTGVQTGSLSFGIEGADGLAQITLSGEGVTEGGGDGGATDGGGTGDGGGTTSGGVEYSTSSLAFGNVGIGSSDSESVVITNNSGGDVLIRDIVTSSSVLTTAGIVPPLVLSDGSTKTMSVTFTPTAERSYSETVTVETDAGDQVISVTGTGEDVCSICAPVIDVDTGGSSGTSMEFGSILGIPDEQTVLVLNIGDEDLEVRNVHLTNDTLGGGTFGVSWGGSTTVSPGGSTSIRVSYTCASGICADSALDAFDWNILHIESNDPTTPDWEIDLTGAGFGL